MIEEPGRHVSQSVSSGPGSWRGASIADSAPGAGPSLQGSRFPRQQYCTSFSKKTDLSSRADVLDTVGPEWQLAMVYYFTSTVVSPSAFIYVGKDKFESMHTQFARPARESS